MRTVIWLIEHIIIAPFGTLDEFYYDEGNQIPKKQIAKRRDYTAHANDDEEYSSDECNSDDEEGGEPNPQLEGDMTIDEFWAQMELAPRLWPKAIDTILHILPGTEIVVHLYHYLQRPRSESLWTELKRKTAVFYFVGLLAFPALHLGEIKVLETHPWGLGSRRLLHMEDMLSIGRAMVSQVTREEFEGVTLGDERFPALKLTSELMAEAKQHLSKVSGR
ncbi:hypothetical protein KVT40_001872 [Elsinoe batatas]|uniref:Uncharacterized protein n=1 Tax=Elsinoe batatas TaxID=2601811 RepID=A0A8K0PK59_9PEZI|nr:hypothetical protein KVT40_001872 [Elsinoe batatas]